MTQDKLNKIENKTKKFSHKLIILRRIAMEIANAEEQMVSRINEYQAHYSKRLDNIKKNIEEDYIRNFEYSEENNRFYWEYYMLNLKKLQNEITSGKYETKVFLNNLKNQFNREIRDYFKMGTSGIRQPDLYRFIECKVNIELLIPLMDELLKM